MTFINSCPECGNSLSEKSKRCSCGWNKPQQATPTITDHRCLFTALSKRCPLPGTISPSTHGSTWYCRRHYRTLGDRLLGEAELHYIEKNYQQILNEEYQDWRSKLNKGIQP